MGTLDGSEGVLCVPAADVDRIFGGARGFIPIGEHPYAILGDLLRDARFLPRTEELERDAATRQLIPYGFLTHAGDVFAYRRTKRGGEARLHARASIGIGGHINPGDGFRQDPETLRRGLGREVDEEANCRNGGRIVFRAVPVGFLIDDTAAVESVHLGIVYRIDLLSRAITPGPEVEPLGWFPVADLRGLDVAWEVWSRLAIEGLWQSPRSVPA